MKFPRGIHRASFSRLVTLRERSIQKTFFTTSINLTQLTEIFLNATLVLKKLKTNSSFYNFMLDKILT